MTDAYVVDASAFVNLLTRKYDSSVLERILADGQSIKHIPHLCDIEVASALRKRVIGRELDEDEAIDRLSQYGSLGLERHHHLGVLPLLIRYSKNFTAYDACYVALAEQLSAPLVTIDRRLARAARQHSAITIIDA